MFHYRSGICGVVIHIMTFRDLRRAAVPSAVMRDNTEPFLNEEDHLSVPIITAQGPAVVKNNWLARAPVLIKYFNAIFGLHCSHVQIPFLACGLL